VSAPVAVITGGAQGIGLAVGHQLGERGHHVAILDLNEETGNAAVQELNDKGASASFFHCDVTDYQQVQRVASQVRAEFADPSVLANCAGYTVSQPFQDQDTGIWRKLVEINFVSVLNTCHAFGGNWPEGASIVNVASDAARVGVAGQSVYAGAKAAVIGFSKSLAMELARSKVRVNVVSPGSTNTPMLRGMFTEEELAKRVRIIRLGRFGEPEDVASVITFLALDALHVTGQVVSVNGGALRVG
jgi:2-hydroxycyclohexanecarboxyl-CoA dehydrogenase